MSINCKTKSKLIILVKYLIFFTLLFVLNKAGINNKVYPFAFGIFFALLWCNQNIFGLCIVYLLAGFLSNFNYWLLLANGIFVVLILLIYGIHYKLKKPLKYIHILIYACLCNLPKLFIEIYFLKANIYLSLVSLILGLLYMFVCVKFFESVLIRGIGGRKTNLENMCGLVFIGSVFCGLFTLSYFNIDLIKYFGALVLLLANYVSNPTYVLFIASSMGLGAMFNSGNLTYFAVFMVYSLTVTLFKTKNKYITIVALLAVECLCGLYFNLYIGFDVFDIIPLLASVLTFIIIPNKILDGYSAQVQETLSSITQASVINKNRELLHKRLVELSDVFNEMNKVFRNMITGNMISTDARRMMYNQVKIKACSECPNRGKCYKLSSKETAQAIQTMVDIAFEKGKVNLLDVPTLFAGKCEKLNLIVTDINDLISQYKNYAGLVNNIDASKVLLAEQLLGVSNIMHDLSLEVNSGVNFENGKERKIIDELTYNNIICSNALVFEDRENIMSVTLAVRKEDAVKAGISKVVSKICNHSMEISDEMSSARAGWQIVTLKSAPKYDIVFGVCTKTKTGSTLSGDCYSIIKINDGKYVFSLCDGMGSGQKAEQTSSTALGLLENFYKAGFNQEIIFSSVNKLLSLGQEDVFSALDLCVVDIREGLCDFIKMGAPESFIKHKETISTIKIGALPLGIVQNIETRSEQVYLSSGDKIIMMTDGISDGFESTQALTDFLNNLSTNNPQEMADAIINKVLEKNSNIAKDDMSVIVAKVFEK